VEQIRVALLLVAASHFCFATPFIFITQIFSPDLHQCHYFFFFYNLKVRFLAAIRYSIVLLQKWSGFAIISSLRIGLPNIVTEFAQSANAELSP
jgi:hypothetical protein